MCLAKSNVPSVRLAKIVLSLPEKSLLYLQLNPKISLQFSKMSGGIKIKKLWLASRMSYSSLFHSLFYVFLCRTLLQCRLLGL